MAKITNDPDIIINILSFISYLDNPTPSIIFGTKHTVYPVYIV